VSTRVWLTIPQVAAIIKSSRATVYRHLYAGQFVHTEIGTGSRPCVRIAEDSVHAFLASRATAGRKSAVAA
jgi:predicted DNA-binding transcriptional regulator AlpA